MVRKKYIPKGDHVAVFYENADSRWQILADYFREGLEGGELCVLVISDSPSEVTARLKAAGLDTAEAISSGDLRMFDMLGTYLSDGRFVADFMVKNVRSFIADAEAQGYNGIRTAGEMEWMYPRPNLQDEAAVYEGMINDVSLDSPSFTGICMYSLKPGSMNIVKNALRTHPAFIYDGELHENPYFTSNSHSLIEYKDELTLEVDNMPNLKHLMTSA